MMPWRRSSVLTSVACTGLMLGGWYSSRAADASDETALATDFNANVALDLYLEVNINGESTHSIVSFVRKAGQLYARTRDLKELGVELGAATAAADGSIVLDGIAGLTFEVDEVHQSIDFRLSDALRAPYALGRSRRAPAVASAGTGLLINYDVYAQSLASQSFDSSLALQNEQRLFGDLGVFSNSGILTFADQVSHYVRQSTTFENDDPASLSATRLGDTLSSSLGWSRPVRLGGVQWSRDFALRPDLVTFPIPQLAGSAAVPSTVDLYVNNVRQLSSDIPSGPFVINGAASITGAGMATLVVRDPLGRSVSATLPIYIDSRLLSAGLSSFSVELGALRFNYGLHSFDYEGHAASSATYRYGLSDLFTLEAHGEATAKLANAGFGALWRLGHAGVLNVSLTGSSNADDSQAQVQIPVTPSVFSAGAARYALPGSVPQAENLYDSRTGNGGQAAVGYQYITPTFSLTAQSTRLFGNYADLAALGGTPAPRLLDQVTASVPLSGLSTVGASFVHVNDAVSGRSSIAELWCTGRLTRSLSTFINASRDFAHANSTTVSIGLSVDFGNRLSGFTTAGRNNGQNTYSASMSRSADYGGGWEWAGQVNRNTSTTGEIGRLGYLGRYGDISTTVEQFEGHTNLAVDAYGGLLLMDGVVEPSRRLGTGFALVSTDGAPGVTILHDNRILGVTDGSGHLLVPDLNPYDHNNLAIDTLALPAEDKLPVNRLDVTPRNLSGVLARFPIEHYRAVTLTLVDDNGQYLPAGSSLKHLETGREFIVGFDGLAFIDDVGASNHLRADLSGSACTASFEANEAAQAAASLRYVGRIACQGKGAAP